MATLLQVINAPYVCIPHPSSLCLVSSPGKQFTPPFHVAIILGTFISHLHAMITQQTRHRHLEHITEISHYTRLP
jgi:hypothetical protein